MQGMNRVILCGQLGREPEIQISKAGKPYCRLALVTDRSFLSKEDKWEKKSEWHSVFVWGPLAERCCHNYRKGATLFVEGSLTYWKVAQTRGDEYKNAIQAERVNLIYQAAPRQNLAPSDEAVEGDFESFADGDYAGHNTGNITNDEDLDNPPGSRNHNAVAHPA